MILTRHSTLTFSIIRSHWRTLKSLHIKPDIKQHVTRCLKHSKATSLFCNRLKAVGEAAVVELDLNMDVLVDKDSYLRMWKSINSRGLVHLKLKDMKETYAEYDELKQQRDNLELEKDTISQKFSELMKNKDAVDIKTLNEEKRLLQEKGKEVKQQLKDTQVKFADLEEKVITFVLQLPNYVHDLAPKGVSRRHLTRQWYPPKEFDFEAKSYMELCGENLEFSPMSPKAYYLKGKLAMLEQALIHYTTDHLLEAGFEQMSCPDMFKTPVFEACSLHSEEKKKIFSVQPRHSEISKKGREMDADYHLIGSSVASFAAYLMRQNVAESDLPLLWFNVGRNYNPDVCSDYYIHDDYMVEYQGLFGVHQNTVVEVFAAGVDQRMALKLFEYARKQIYMLYAKFKIPMGQINPAPRDMRMSESLVSNTYLRLPSTGFNYQVGQVSLCNDYISRRLMMRYSKKDDSKSKNYLHTVHGTALIVPRVIAILVEQGQTKDGKFTLPDVLQPYMPTAQQKQHLQETL